METTTKLPKLLEALLIAKRDIKEPIAITSSKFKNYPAAAKSLESYEKFLGVDCAFYLVPGKERCTLSEPKLGRTVTGEIIITSQDKHVISPKLTMATLAPGGGSIVSGTLTMKIACALEKDIQSVMLEDLDTPEEIKRQLGLVGAPITDKVTGKIVAVDTIVYTKEEKKSYRNFVQTENGQYSFYTNSDITENLAKQVGKQIKDCSVGDISVGYAKPIDEIEVPEGGFEANLLRVEVEKITSAKTGRSFDAFTMVTDKGNFSRPSKSMKRDLMAFSPTTPMKLVKLSKESDAYLVSDTLSQMFADLL